MKFHKTEKLIQPEQLAHFLRNYLRAEGITQKEFIGESLAPSIFSRLLSGKSDVKEDTIIKIAKIVLKKNDATIEELKRTIENTKFESEKTILRFSSGFTVWGGVLCGLIETQYEDGRNMLPEGVEFTFCSEGDNPFWLSNPDHINEIKQNPQKFKYKYVAGDLQRLLDNGEVDCAFLLKSTFKEMKFAKLTEPPIIYSRVANGYGTHMNLIKKVATPNATNEIVQTNTFREVITAIDRFGDEIKNKNIRIGYIGNATINHQLSKFLADDKIDEILQQNFRSGFSIDITQISLGTENYERFLSLNLDFIKSGGIVLIAAFEPLNNIVYHDILANAHEEDRTFIKYQNYNLSRLLNDKSSYCLVVTVESLRNPEKVLKINELLNALDNIDKNPLIDKKLADFFFQEPLQTSIYDESKFTRMKNALNDLTFVNSNLHFINTISNIWIPQNTNSFK